MSHLLIAFAVVFLQPDSSRVYLADGQRLEEQGYLDKALAAYANARRFKGTEAAALNGIASVSATTGKYDSIEFFLRRSRSLDGSPANLTINYQSEARYLQARNEYDLALASLQLAKENAEKAGDIRNQAIILSSMGSIHFSHTPDKTVARDFILKSNALLDSSIHYNILARNYGRLANTAMASNDGVAGRAWLERARKIVVLSENLPVRSYILSSFAILYFEEGKFEESIEALKEPIRIRRELGQLRQLQNDLLNLSETYMMIKKYDEAEKALDEVRTISRSLKDHVYLKYYYERASMLDSLRGNYRSAYSNYKLAMKYKDSTFSAQHLRDVHEIQEKYEAEQKEKIIAEKELEINNQKYRQTLILSTATVAVLIIVVVSIVLRSRNRRQQNHLRLQAIVKTQEDVQQRIARDLHDGLVQVLGAAKMSLQSIGPESDKAVLQKHIRNASDIVDEAVTEARSISHQVLPYSLLKDGLVSALEELFARSLSSVEFDHDEAIDVDEPTAINIYRIAQELVNNVQKHAASARVTASLKVAGKQIRFVFSDNGPGFDTGNPRSGAGISNMSTRAELMGGTISVRSTPGKGTTTELIIPL